MFQTSSVLRFALVARGVGALLIAGVAAPVAAQVNGPGQTYSTAPRPVEPYGPGYAAPPGMPPAVVVMPAPGTAYPPGRGQRPPAIRTAPNVVLGWGGLPPVDGQPQPGAPYGQPMPQAAPPVYYSAPYR